MEKSLIYYGINPVEELIKNRPLSVEHVFFEKGRKNSRLFELMKLCRKERLPYNLVPEIKLRNLTSTTRHQGIAATAGSIPYWTEENFRDRLLSKTDPVVLLAASIEDPGNLGAVIRSVVAFGADGLLLERKNTASLTPAVAKSSAGALEHCPIARPRNLEAFLMNLKSSGFRLIGTSMEGGAPPCGVVLKGPLIIMLGGEHRGIPPYLSKLCSEDISIPMSGKINSLNVAATAAIILYEIARQRKAST